MSDDDADAEDVARALASGAAQAAREVVRERARETPVLTSGDADRALRRPASC